MSLELSIVTPDQEAVHVDCDEVAAPGINGEIGLLPDHVPVVTALRPGVLTVVSEGKKSYYAVSTGFVEMEGEKVTVLTAQCDAAADVDVERARKDFEEAEAALKDLGEQDADFEMYQTRLRRAEARLMAAELA